VSSRTDAGQRPATSTALDRPTIGVPKAVRSIAGLKWTLLRGGLRGSNQQKIQVGLSLVLSMVFGLLAFAGLSAVGRGSSNAGPILVVLLPVTAIGVGLLSAATGVEATIDARHLATEPLTRTELGVGLLGAAVVGPPAVLAMLAGAGIAFGWASGVGAVGVVLVVAVVVGWWLTLLLLSRTLANLLGAWATGRFRQIAQAMATVSALLVWLLVQIVTRDVRNWDSGRWDTLADVARWTPPGQLGVAGASVARPGEAALHLVIGLAWLPFLAWANVVSTERLALSSPRPGSGGKRMRTAIGGLRSGPIAWLPAGPVGAVAARTIRTKFRTPRQAVNTVTALVIGAGVFLVGPVLDGGVTDDRLVLIGGLLHFAVLFDGNNSFGVDGPALWMEIQAGADARILARAKVLSSIGVMAIPATLLPVGLAALSGGWAWLPAAWLLAAGALFAASGVSVATAALAPVAMPDSPNPLASGDTGQGCLAAVMLVIGLIVLAVVSAPVGVPVLLASSRSAGLTAAAALLGPLVGLLVLWGGVTVAITRLDGREAELVQKVTPAR
jgi:ABC-2 type transport system permease protein